MQRTTAVVDSRQGRHGVEQLSTAEFATLRYASFPSAGFRPARPATFRGKRKSLFASFFASLIGAIHHSRRVQSRRFLRQYRHLIYQGDQRTACNLQPNARERNHVDR
jgi:hypothetical protein